MLPQHDWTSKDPLRGIARPRTTVKVEAFTPAEIFSLLEHADAATELLLRLSASTGLRIGESFGLQFGDIDFERGLLRVQRQYTHGAWSQLKTENARRVIPLGADLLRRLSERRAELDGEVARLPGPDDRLVFADSAGGPHHYNNWRNRVWAPLCKSAGVSGTVHMLRHSYATTLIQSGESAPTVARLVGHSLPSTTMNIYASHWPDAISLSAEKVHGLLFADRGSKTVAKADELEKTACPS